MREQRRGVKILYRLPSQVPHIVGNQRQAATPQNCGERGIPPASQNDGGGAGSSFLRRRCAGYSLPSRVSIRR
jgi:hypothetical protein